MAALAAAVAKLTQHQKTMELQYAARLSKLQTSYEGERAKCTTLTAQLRAATSRSESDATRTRTLKSEMERLRALVESDVLAVDRGRRVAWGGPADGATLRGAGREKFWQRMATPHLLDRSEPPTEFSAASVSGGRAAGALRAGGSSFGTIAAKRSDTLGLGAQSRRNPRASDFEKMVVQLRKVRASLAESEEQRTRGAEENRALRAELATLRRERVAAVSLQRTQNAGALRRIHFLAVAKEEATVELGKKSRYAAKLETKLLQTARLLSKSQVALRELQGGFADPTDGESAARETSRLARDRHVARSGSGNSSGQSRHAGSTPGRGGPRVSAALTGVKSKQSARASLQTPLPSAATTAAHRSTARGGGSTARRGMSRRSGKKSRRGQAKEDLESSLSLSEPSAMARERRVAALTSAEEARVAALRSSLLDAQQRELVERAASASLGVAEESARGELQVDESSRGVDGDGSGGVEVEVLRKGGGGGGGGAGRGRGKKTRRRAAGAGTPQQLQQEEQIPCDDVDARVVSSEYDENFPAEAATSGIHRGSGVQRRAAEESSPSHEEEGGGGGACTCVFR